MKREMRAWESDAELLTLASNSDGLISCVVSAECVREVLGRNVETNKEAVLYFIATALYYKVILSQTCCCTNKFPKNT